MDDCSIDDSIRVIEKFIRSKADGFNIQIVKLTENAGQMNAFVEGFRRSSGSFVVFVDADDYLFPDFVETHLAAHLSTQYPPALTCSNQVIVDEGNRALTGWIEKVPAHWILLPAPLPSWRKC